MSNWTTAMLLPLLEFSTEDQEAIEEAAVAWAMAYPHASKAGQGTGDPNIKTRFEGDTADEILERHGIRFGKCFTGPEPWRYGKIVAEVQRIGRLRIKNRWPLTPYMERRMQQLWSAGMKAEAIAEKLGHHPATIYRALRRTA